MFIWIQNNMQSASKEDENNNTINHIICSFDSWRTMRPFRARAGAGSMPPSATLRVEKKKKEKGKQPLTIASFPPPS